MQSQKFYTRIPWLIRRSLFFTLTSIGLSLIAHATTVMTLTVASNSFSPWICPAGVTSISVAVQGGGGGGGSRREEVKQGGRELEVGVMNGLRK